MLNIYFVTLTQVVEYFNPAFGARTGTVVFSDPVEGVKTGYLDKGWWGIRLGMRQMA